ncbi:hypothetical protein CN311_16065 [Mesorhizobium sanjuanii]|uniref:Uncharacterized protein n=1 Tax=Mesorhizobium sanjuanii TaxID=2037900 RepID=A0A2A6FEN5_9HYPH|nr:hypothetical protein CN311_16065 [Mesorhizobium sanjuanii]
MADVWIPITRFGQAAPTKATRDTLFQLMRCPLDSDAITASQIDQVACNWFVAEGLKQLNDVNDFTIDTNGH